MAYISYLIKSNFEKILKLKSIQYRKFHTTFNTHANTADTLWRLTVHAHYLYTNSPSETRQY